jgi:hypothetical protein
VGTRWNEGKGLLNFAELCRKVGISRRVGYGGVARYREAQHDVRGVQQRSRRPLTSPSKDHVAVSHALSTWRHSFPEELEDLLIAARKAHATCGPHHPRRDDFLRCRRALPIFAAIYLGQSSQRGGQVRQRRDYDFGPSRDKTFPR